MWSLFGTPGYDGEVIDKITNTIERFSTKVIEAERHLRNELDTKLDREASKRQNQVDESVIQERLRYERELQDMKVRRMPGNVAMFSTGSNHKDKTKSL
jgi:hypothetical protein